ncbi:MAG: ChaN family lipoprotein, partial [Planctomycetota bacterium]
TEMVQLIHQDHLDAYLAGELQEREFLKEIDYENTWGFYWSNHRLHFEFAREHDIPMLALNSDPAVLKDNLTFRDALAAMVIVEALMRDSEILLAVVFGDLHIAPVHLPSQVQRFLERKGIRRGKHVTVYQNSETLYWDLAQEGLEQSTSVVRLNSHSFCLMNSTPLVKFQSYLNWEMNREELEESRGIDEQPSISSTIMTDQVLHLVKTITDFLEIPLDGLNDFSVHTSRDLDFLDKLETSGHYSESELEEIREQIARDESYFVTRQSLIYLGNLSIDHAAEEASHYINTKLAGHVETPPNRRFDFYYRVMKEAIGFLGSKIINHKRSCWHRAEFEQALEECRGKKLSEPMKLARQITRDVLAHLDYEVRWLCEEERGFPRFRGIYNRGLPVHLGITHSLGYILGDRAYEALVAGRLQRREVRSLFNERFEGGGRPQEYYFDWLDYLR